MNLQKLCKLYSTLAHINRWVPLIQDRSASWCSGSYSFPSHWELLHCQQPAFSLQQISFSGIFPISPWIYTDIFHPWKIVIQHHCPSSKGLLSLLFLEELWKKCIDFVCTHTVDKLPSMLLRWTHLGRSIEWKNYHGFTSVGVNRWVI